MGARWVMVLAVLAAGVLGSYSPLAAAELRPEVEKLFRLGWQNTADARAATIEQAAAIEQLAPADARVPYAQALVHMKQRRFTEAIAALDRVLAVDKQHFPAWRGKIFLLLLTKDYGRGMGTIDVLTAAVPAEIPAAQAAEWEETAAFLGRMLGFLEGPAEGVAEVQLTALRAKVETRLTGRLASLFNDGRTSTLGKYAELTGDKTRIEGANLAEAEKVAEKQKSDLEKQKVLNAERMQTLKSDAERIQSDLSKQLADIDRQAAPIQTQFSIAAQRVNQLESELAGFLNQINSLRAQAAREKDQNQRDRLNREADRVQIFAQRVDSDLSFARRSAGTINGQLVALGNQKASVQNRLGGQLVAINREAQAINKQDARADAVTRKLDGPKNGNSPKTRALSAQAAALSSYDQFPLDAERDRVLAMFQ